MNKSVLCLLATLLPLHADPVTVTVSAAASLRPPLEALKVEFEKAHPDVAVVYNFGSSGSLQQQIVHGAPVDVYISAAAKQMDALEAAGLILSESRFVLLSNTLVLIAPARSQGVSDFGDLAAVGTLAIGEPKSVPVGMYAMEVLKHFGLAEAVKDRMVFAKDARQVLFYVEGGGADAGIAYGSDAVGLKSARVVAEAPAGSHEKIEYPAAIVTASAHVQESAGFLKFLRSPEASMLFKSAGFVTTAP
jgi:molybdate transport system substrate-binding protein